MKVIIMKPNVIIVVIRQEMPTFAVQTCYL